MGRIALSVAGDSSDAKAAVLRLVDDLGFDPMDGGELDESWRQQPGTPAYCQDLEAIALRRARAEADRTRIAEYRGEQEDVVSAGRGDFQRAFDRLLAFHVGEIEFVLARLIEQSGQ